MDIKRSYLKHVMSDSIKIVANSSITLSFSLWDRIHDISWFKWCDIIYTMKNDRFTTPSQHLLTWGWAPHTGSHSHVRRCCAVVVVALCRNQVSYTISLMENVIYTTGTQQGHNTPSHGGGPHILGPTPMWGGVVPL
jgi:hypothetical protein